MRRRAFIQLTAALMGAMPLSLRADDETRAKARIVIIGGGFAGATCARYLRRVDPAIHVILIDEQRKYLACPMSNWVIGGVGRMERLQVNRAGLARAGVEQIHDRVDAVDGLNRQVTLAGGRKLGYDRLVMAPGVDFKWGSPEGYDEAAALRMPHAWRAGEQTVLLHKQLQAMKDGGVVAISVPAAPFRCPPGPYERASLIAHYLKTHKPRSKVLILDANDKFAKQALFKEAWSTLYPGMIEWVPVTEGGAVRRVDAKTMTLYTELEDHKVDVANVIPAQTAGRLAISAGLAEDSGWCAADSSIFESKRMSGVHVIGDACIANPMPKSASAANSQAKNCALAIAALVSGVAPGSPSLHNTCYSLVAPEYGISVNEIFQVIDGKITLVEGAGGISPLNAAAEFRAREAAYDRSWYESIVADSFG
ncbi:MAG TPA: FAD/NAD(P)-binding oxidoreductase [Gammaproteobacteria bacterium]|nr:FAD/NAD(P)-binding oxidoreductase [Gammaproteobacteria bacterium]